MAEDTMMTISNLICSQCGSTVEPGKKFCLQCGAALERESSEQAQPHLCPACGDEVSAKAAFCGSCGVKLRGEKTVPSPLTPAVTSMERSPFADAAMRGQKKGILLGVGICLSVIMLLGIGIVIGRFILDRTGTSFSKGLPDLPPPPPPPPASQAKGQVVTAGGLMETRIFGAEAKEPSRSIAAIQERVEMYLPKLREVYAKELVTHPHLMGIFVLEMTIAPDGHVSQILSHPTYISGKEFQRTVENLVQDWHFDPASTGEVNVFYPLLFTPAEIDPQMITGFVKEIFPGRYKIIATSPVPVRKGPGDETEELGKASAGLKIEVVSSQGGWLGILSPKGKIGYIRQEAVSSRVGSEGETAS